MRVLGLRATFTCGSNAKSRAFSVKKCDVRRNSVRVGTCKRVRQTSMPNGSRPGSWLSSQPGTADVAGRVVTACRASRTFTTPDRPPILTVCLLSVVTSFAAGGSAGAAEANEPEPQTASTEQPSPRAEPDFLFGRPRGLVGVSGGWLLASQSGGIFDLTRDLLTVGERDFDTALVRVGLGLSIAPRADLLFEVGFSGATTASEHRDFVDTDDRPIAQTTEVIQVPLGASARFWLRPRGREVSRFAWVPNGVAPYVGIGGGTRWYRFSQFGDFVDFVDFSIFNARLESTGWAASGHLFAGASIKMTRQLFANVEVRHVWADTPLSGDFLGFDTIDLNGLQITAGVEYVF